jgi:hypothetical protein
MVLIAALSVVPFLWMNAIRLDHLVHKPAIALANYTTQWQLLDLFDGPTLLWSFFGVVATAAVVGLGLLRTRWWGAGVLFVAFAAWNGVRTIAVSIGMIQYDWAPWDMNVWVEESEHPGWVDLLTLDAAVTGAVVVAAFVLRHSTQRDLVYRNLVVIIVASTLVAHTGHFQPPLLTVPVLAVLTLVFPIVYTLLFDAAWIIAQPQRSARVAGVLALSLMVLAFLIVSLPLIISPSRPAFAYGDLAKEMLAVPVLGTLLIVETVWRANGAHAAEGHPQPHGTELISAAGSGDAVRRNAETSQNLVQNTLVRSPRRQKPRLDDGGAFVVDGDDKQN